MLYKSRFETPRVLVNNKAFANKGLGVFSSENIPFAGRTSEFFAKSLISLLMTRIKKLPFRSEYHIYEFGIGNGILAKRLLEILKKNHEDLYAKTTLHLIDSSPSLISELESLQIFSEFIGHVTIEIADATTYRFTKPPFLVYFTNLIDSLPCRHIRIEENGKAFEVKIKTRIRGKTYEEKTRLVPIEKVKNMSKTELEDLKILIKSRSKTGGIQVFNYSYKAKQLIRYVLNSLIKGGFFLVSDFGTTSFTQKGALWSEYGQAIFFSVDFAGLIELANKEKKPAYITNKDPQQPQELLVDTLPNDKTLENRFLKLFNQDFDPTVDAFLSSAESILFNSSKDNALKLKSVRFLYKTLPSPVKQDYRLLNDYAYFLLQANLYKEALRITDELKNNYGHTTGRHYFLIRDAALSALKKGY